MKNSNFSFDKLIPDNLQIEHLYKLLDQRKHPISHVQAVSFEDHEFFVRNHPYRAWYLVGLDDVVVGSFYVSNENTIGINIDACNEEILVLKILNYVEQNYAPLDAIPSVRSGVFSINVSPQNEFLLTALDNLNAKVAQITYYLPDRQNN